MSEFPWVVLAIGLIFTAIAFIVLDTVLTRMLLLKKESKFHSGLPKTRRTINTIWFAYKGLRKDVIRSKDRINELEAHAQYDKDKILEILKTQRRHADTLEKHRRDLDKLLKKEVGK